MAEELHMKLVVLGDIGVGKTSVIRRWGQGSLELVVLWSGMSTTSMSRSIGSVWTSTSARRSFG